MKDNNEQLSAAKAEWLQTLDYDCRVNTINYWALRDQLRFGRLEGLAAKLYGFIKVRGWQKLGVFSADGLKRTVASFSSFVDWCGADFSDGGLKLAPGELFRILTNSIEFEQSADAAKALVQILDPVTLEACSDSFSKITAGHACTYGEHWEEVEQVIEQSIHNPPLQLNQEVVGPEPTKPRANSIPAVLDRLHRYSLSPKLCKQRGTTQAAVKDAYQQLLDGLVRPTTALRIAGLLPPSKTATKSIYMVNDPKEAAKRILKVVGQNNAAEIADQLKTLLAS